MTAPAANFAVVTLASAILAVVIPLALTCKLSLEISNDESSTFTNKVSDDLLRPLPAVTWPAPEN